MDALERLLQAGILPDCAEETVAWYRQQGNEHGLELYVEKVENRHNVRLL